MFEQIAEHRRPNGAAWYVSVQQNGKMVPRACKEQYIYVLYKDGRTRPTRVIATNTMQKDWRLGTVLTLWGRTTNLGYYKIVGVGDTQNFEFIGDIPKTLLAYAHF